MKQEEWLKETKRVSRAVSRNREQDVLAFKVPQGQIVGFADKVTYTFFHRTEVASIHFDMGRGEIFYKGHNIRNMALDDVQSQRLEELAQILDGHEKMRAFVEPFRGALKKARK